MAAGRARRRGARLPLRGGRALAAYGAGAAVFWLWGILTGRWGLLGHVLVFTPVIAMAAIWEKASAEVRPAQPAGRWIVEASPTTAAGWVAYLAFAGLGGVSALAAMFLAGWEPGLLAFGCWLGVLKLLTWPRQLSVGKEGLLLGRLGRTRFLSWAEVSACDRTQAGVVLSLRSGEAIELGPLGGGAPLALEAERRALVEAVTGAFAESRSAGSGALSTARLARGGRTALDWVRALRESTRREAAHFREEPLSEASLWSVVEDRRSADALRAAAAAALSPGLSEVGRARLRVAAEEATSGLCVALEAAADADDRRLLEALEALDAPARGSGRVS